MHHRVTNFQSNASLGNIKPGDAEDQPKNYASQRKPIRNKKEKKTIPMKNRHAFVPFCVCFAYTHLHTVGNGKRSKLTNRIAR